MNLKQHHLNEENFSRCVLYLADVYENGGVTKLNERDTKIINDIVAEYCVPHPINKIFCTIELILKDLKRRRWKKKRTAKWLKSLAYEGKPLLDFKPNK